MSSFKDLDLSSVEFSTRASVLPAGRHVCEVTNAEWYETKSGGKAVKLVLSSTKGDGVLNGMLNVVNRNDVAQRIGREQLKAMLTFGGHPTPDKPGDIASLRGLKVGVSVGTEKYTDSFGEQKDGSVLKGFFDPSGLDGGSSDKGADNGGDNELDDDIPF